MTSMADRETLTLPTETIERVTDALNALISVAEATHGAQERVEHARAALRELATMTSFAMNTPDLAEDLRESNAALTEALREIDYQTGRADEHKGRGHARLHLDNIRNLARAALTVSNTQPRFMTVNMVDDGTTSEPTFATLGDLAGDNQDDEPFVAWLYRARIGESYRNGGGAAPLFVTWRVS